MNPAEPEREPIEELAEDFMARYRRGERPSSDEYVRQRPDLAGEIRDLFPALLLLEERRAVEGEREVSGPPLRQLGEYRIVREVGRGGMGVVYEAIQESLGRRVALKVLPSPALLEPVYLERFHREAQAAARLTHPNIVPVHGVGEANGVHFFVMQFIDGQGLNALVHEARRLREGQSERPVRSTADTPQTSLATQVSGKSQPVLKGQQEADAPRSPDWLRSPAEYYRQAARIIAQAADALAYAHGQGVLHRDIKPANLLLEWRAEGVNAPVLWITDFGLARAEGQESLSGTGDLVGTLRYLAPERFHGWADPRSDLYSLGLTLYELLTLRPVFDAPDRAALVRQVTQQEPPAPRRIDRSIPRDLETIVLKAIAPEPAQRYVSGIELADDLRRFLEDRPIRARRATTWEHAWRWCRRNPALTTVSGVALAAVLTALVLVTWQWRRAEDSADHARTQQSLAETSAELARQEAERAEKRRQQAEASLRTAGQSIELMLLRVGREELAAVPQMEQVRKQLLDDALPLFQQLLREHPEDPALRHSAARAYRQAAQISKLLGHQEKVAEYLTQSEVLLEKLAQEFPQAPVYRQDMARTLTVRGSWLVHHHRGRLPEAEQVFLQAMDLQKKLTADHPDEAAYQNDLALTCNNLGVRFTMAAQHQQAEPFFRQGLELQEKVVAQHANVTEYRITLALLQRNLGAAYTSLNQPKEAEQAMRAALREHEKVLATDITNLIFRRQVAESHYNLGSYLARANRSAEAEQSYRQAQKLLEPLAADFPTMPGNRQLLGSTWKNLGLLYLRDGRAKEAEQAYQQAVTLLEKLIVDFPSLSGAQAPLAESCAGLGQLHAKNNQLPQAEQVYRRAVVCYDKLAGEPPGQPQYRRLAAVNRNRLAVVLLRQNRPQEAEQLYREELVARQELAARFPQNADYRSECGGTLNDLALVVRDLGDLPEARQLLEQALAHQQAALKARPGHPTYRQFLRNHHSVLTGVLLRLEDHTTAARHARALAEVFPERGPDSHAAAGVLARCVPLTEKDARLSQEQRGDLARTYADEAMKHLQASVQRGFKDGDQLARDPAFTSLRSREDFKKLVADLREKGK